MLASHLYWVNTFSLSFVVTIRSGADATSLFLKSALVTDEDALLLRIFVRIPSDTISPLQQIILGHWLVYIGLVAGGLQHWGMSKTHYEVLEIPRSASHKGIKSAYKKLANRYHPDKHPFWSDEEKRAGEEKFKIVKQAYEILSNSETRTKYDSELDPPAPGPPPPPPPPPPPREPLIEIVGAQFGCITSAPGGTSNRQFRISNAGGGSLLGSITSSAAWLNLSTNQLNWVRECQVVEFAVDSSSFHIGHQYGGIISIRSNGGDTDILVSAKIDFAQADLSWYRTPVFWTWFSNVIATPRHLYLSAIVLLIIGTLFQSIRVIAALALVAETGYATFKERRYSWVMGRLVSCCSR